MGFFIFSPFFTMFGYNYPIFHYIALYTYFPLFVLISAILSPFPTMSRKF